MTFFTSSLNSVTLHLQTFAIVASVVPVLGDYFLQRIIKYTYPLLLME